MSHHRSGGHEDGADDDTIHYAFTIDDPMVWSTPIRGEVPMLTQRRRRLPGAGDPTTGTRPQARDT